MDEELEQRLQKLESQAGSSAGPSRFLRLLPWMAIGHLAVGAPTLIISLIVAYGTYVQAQATQRMQQAAAWPFVAYGTSNYTPDGKHRINLTLQNNGVGPALLGPIELRYRGKVMRGPRELLEACCGYHRGERMQLTTAPPTDVVLRPGESIAFMELADVPANARLLPRLETERWKVQVRSCYCSIFDECWTIDGIQSRPKPVETCPANWVTYKER
ncbi:hypothetical protein [Sphingomonas sp.]|uniref:hypothetical protein n=1 Tax=Sphingomonas sp. TaxID=28214 RepID=UPI0035C80D3A